MDISARVVSRIFVIVFVVGVIAVLEMGKAWAPIFVLGYGALLITAHVIWTISIKVGEEAAVVTPKKIE